MEIIEFDAKRPDLIDQAFALIAAAHDADTPENPSQTERFFKTTFTHAFPGREKHWFAALEGDVLVGYARIAYFTDENTELAFFDIIVHPKHRRQGHGAALLDLVERRCAADGRTTALTSVPVYWEGGPAREGIGAAALARRDYELALTTVNRRSPVDPLGADEEARRFDEALAKAGDAYEVRQWIGATPDDLVDTMCRMETMIVSEIPLGEIEMAPEAMTPEKLRAKEAVYAVEGRRWSHTVAVESATGEVVAWTAVAVDEGDEVNGHQGITIVDPGHRGHRLGLLVKLANLRQLRATFPDLAHIWTDNADVNAHMIAINELMGYTTVDANADYQRKLA
ncbi:GNAT family N-acetyltransferase [Glycomyces sp. NPDC046736]|uniref:GNAT family N-acetyltransferase n=1 Tax=Glycomyces sp. NPDC046736 TaxID=3155615 RepID=UPI0033DC53A6